MKLQDMIDAAFGASENPRSPQVPSEAFKERGRAFSDRAKKIQALRLARVEGAGETVPESFVIEIVRYRGHWRTLHCNKHSYPFPDQTAAITAAKELALVKRKQGRGVKVVLRRADGNEVTQAIR